MRLHFRIEQEFGRKEPIKPLELAQTLKLIITKLDLLLDTQKSWYEQGYSKKEALEHKVFIEGELSDEVLSRWENKCKTEYPNWTVGIWDGEADEVSSGIDFYPSYSSTNRRENPLQIVVNFNANVSNVSLNVDSMIDFIKGLLQLHECCTYLSVESAGYSFSEIVPRDNGYDEIYKKVFPDRVSCGWMIFVPMVVTEKLIPNAERLVPIIIDGKQIGTIVVSTEEVFDGNNKMHIAKSNDIEIRLLDLGLLPLMTEL